MSWPSWKGLGEGIDDVFGDALDRRFVCEAGQQHGEFVAALARHRVGFAHAADDAARRLDEQAVAGFVAEGVVDLLEAGPGR